MIKGFLVKLKYVTNLPNEVMKQNNLQWLYLQCSGYQKPFSHIFSIHAFMRNKSINLHFKAYVHANTAFKSALTYKNGENSLIFP